jgi:predicted RNA methylase
LNFENSPVYKDIKMNVSEKQTEARLDAILTRNGFSSETIFYSPAHHPDLEAMFARASKKPTSTNRGIPDRIILSDSVCIVIECKPRSIHQAVKDLHTYKRGMGPTTRALYFVAFVDEALYKIFDGEMTEKTLMTLTPASFGLADQPILQGGSKEEMQRVIHRIHNYIRDNTKISSEDKSFFIAIILISLQNPAFRELAEGNGFTSSPEYIYDLLALTMRDFDIDISVFEFMRNDNNNVHLARIIGLILEIPLDTKVDLLNLFYAEFVKYSNTDSKSLGIVLTPPHIVALMVELLDIRDDDVVLDLCTGTGSFLLEALRYKPKQVIGCEYQTKLFQLLKCNLLLAFRGELTRGFGRGDNAKALTFKEDCFQRDFTARSPTKSVINPPYGMKDKRELDFVLKQLDSVVDGGVCVSIIPISKLNGSNPLKVEVFKRADIQFIIRCNPQLFYPTAGVECCVLGLVKRTASESAPSVDAQDVILVDYREDGVATTRGNVHSNVERLQRNVVDAVKSRSRTYRIRVDDDWAFVDLAYRSVEGFFDPTPLHLDALEAEYIKARTALIARGQAAKIPLRSSALFRLDDLFTITRGRCATKKSDAVSGTIPLITASGRNHGISGCVDTAPFTHCITVASNGTVGSAFYHDYAFDACPDVCVLVPKDSAMSADGMRYVCCLLRKFKDVYNYNRKWTVNKMREDHIELPVDEHGEIDWALITSIVNKN